MGRLDTEKFFCHSYLLHSLISSYNPPSHLLYSQPIPNYRDIECPNISILKSLASTMSSYSVCSIYWRN